MKIINKGLDNSISVSKSQLKIKLETLQIKEVQEFTLTGNKIKGLLANEVDY